MGKNKFNNKIKIVKEPEFIKFIPSGSFLIFLVGFIIFCYILSIDLKDKDALNKRNKKDQIWIWVFFTILLLGNIACLIFFIYYSQHVLLYNCGCNIFNSIRNLTS